LAVSWPSVTECVTSQQSGIGISPFVVEKVPILEKGTALDAILYAKEVPTLVVLGTSPSLRTPTYPPISVIVPQKSRTDCDSWQQHRAIQRGEMVGETIILAGHRSHRVARSTSQGAR